MCIFVSPSHIFASYHPRNTLQELLFASFSAYTRLERCCRSLILGADSTASFVQPHRHPEALVTARFLSGAMHSP